MPMKSETSSLALTRRSLLLGAASSFAPQFARAQRPASVLRVIHGANLLSLDPVWTTSPATKDFAFMVYDQLIAVDSKFIPRPQMLKGWTVSPDGRVYTMELREQLKFHDGEPVRSGDCIASIQRWAGRDGFGQLLATVITEMKSLGDKRFEIRLNRAFPLLPNALGKANTSQCFVMPERIAKTSPSVQIKEAIGSGPFRFVANEWVSGSRAVFARFADYAPRSEAADGLAGRKVAEVERVEWTILGDPATASAAMEAGEQDYWDAAIWDLAPQLRSSGRLVVGQRDVGGSYCVLRFNSAQPPFNNVELRRAVAMAVDQRDYLQAIAGDNPDAWSECHSFYACGTPYGKNSSTGILNQHNLAKARDMLKASGYSGQRVVLLAAMDLPGIAAASQVTNELLKKIGFNVDFVATDFSTVTQRRTNREPVEKGGWSIFHTALNGIDFLNPETNQPLRANGDKAWFGWPTDARIEQLREQWLYATDEATRASLAADIEKRAYEVLPYLPLGRYAVPHAWSKSVQGVKPELATFYFNLRKVG
jgi:peptide/nickel transport system substrate-binding protein